MAPSQKEQIERLSSENTLLKEKVDSLTETVQQLKAAIELLSVSHGETTVRVEAVEDNLCSVKSDLKELEHDLTATMLRLEGQQMYTRKQTLLLTGSAVELPVRGEDTRDVVLKLLSTHLGVSNISKGDISACHRLKNPKVILVRFTHMNNSDRVYKARTKPKRHGLLIFESLTSERLSVIELLKSLKNDQSSPVLSYFTQAGKIFIRTSENRDVKPIEIPFGCGVDQIHELCAGKRVDPSDATIRDQFRAIHGGGAGRGSGERQGHVPNPWVTVGSRNRANRAAPPAQPAPGRGGSGDRPSRDARQVQGTGATGLSSHGPQGGGEGAPASQHQGGSSVTQSDAGSSVASARDGSTVAPSSADPSQGASSGPPADA